MNEKLEQIKAECRKAIELGEKATSGPWESDDQVIEWLNGMSPAVAVRSSSANGSSSPVCMVQPHLSGRYFTAGTLNPLEDASFIAHSRTFSPNAAKTWLKEIQWLENHASGAHDWKITELCQARLQSICDQWEEGK